MGIDLKGFRAVYKNELYNAVCAIPEFYGAIHDGIQQPTKLELWVISMDGIITMIRDDFSEFQFIKTVN